MQNQRVLITGGAGLIGSHIADLLVERGVHEIVVLDNFVRGRRENLSARLGGRPVTWSKATSATASYWPK